MATCACGIAEDEHGDGRFSTGCSHHLRHVHREGICSAPAVLRGRGCTWLASRRLAQLINGLRDGDRSRSIEALGGRGS